MPITQQEWEASGQTGIAPFSPPVDQTTPTTPTLGDTFGDINYQTDDERSFIEAEGQRARTAAEQITDPETIRSQTMDRFQAEIDAINKVYNEKKREETTRGLGRLGSLSAIQGRRGLLGSSFGGTQEDLQETANVQVQSAIEAERGSKVSNVRNAALGLAQKEIESRVAARRQGADDYLAFINASAERKKSNTEEIARKLYDDDAFEGSNIQEIADSLGVSIKNLTDTYNTYKKEQDAVKVQAEADAQAQLAEEAKEVEAENIKRQESLLKSGYSYVKTPATRDRLISEGYDITEIAGRTYAKKPKLKTETRKIGSATYSITTDEMGNITKKTLINGGGTGVPSGTDKDAQEEMTGAMNDVTGDDGFISPDDYKTLRKQWVDAGQSATTFDTKFKGYRNINNPNYITTKQ